jgi:hypothetical protein
MADKDKTKSKVKKRERPEKPIVDGPPLPGTRAELMDLHRQTRARRNAAALGSPEHVEAIVLISRIEVEIARIERAMDPPRG